MGNINEDKKKFLAENDIGLGTSAWRVYIDFLGFTGGSLVGDTKRMLIDIGYWDGSMSSSLSLLFSDETPPPPLGDFTYDAVYNVVTFTNPVGISGVWDFDDGETTPDDDPVHVYPMHGTYNVTLVGANPQELAIGPLYPPVASFTATPTDLTVVFDSSSSSTTTPPLTYLWDFGDTESSTQASPTHEYNTEGTKDVVLTIKDDVGTCDTYEDSVVVSDPVPENPELLPADLAASDGDASGISGVTFGSQSFVGGERLTVVSHINSRHYVFIDTLGMVGSTVYTLKARIKGETLGLDALPAVADIRNFTCGTVVSTPVVCDDTYYDYEVDFTTFADPVGEIRISSSADMAIDSMSVKLKV